jgi:hypothetical protein
MCNIFIKNSLGVMMKIKKLKLIVGSALVGSVLTGATVGFISFQFPFDPRIIGASIFALFAARKLKVI